MTRVHVSGLAVIDIEASGLPPGTFPVEIAVSIVETGHTQSWVIRPAQAWSALAWDPEAERLHGFTPERLLTEGRSAHEVYAELQARVNGHTVLCDSMADHTWLGILARAAGHTWTNFAIGCMWQKVSELTAGNQDTYERASLRAHELFPGRHKAASDAARWAYLVRLLAGAEA